MKRTIDQLPTAKNKQSGASLAGTERSLEVKSDSKSGLRWDPKRLATIPAEWSGDEILDGAGLVGEIRVAKNSAVSVRFRYAFKWQNKNEWFQCGTWPKNSLADIRQRRKDANALLTEGINPKDHKRAEKIENQARIEESIARAETANNNNKTFFDMYSVWLENGVKRSDGNAEIKRSFEKDVLPGMRDIPVKKITEHDIRTVLHAMAVRKVGRSTELRYNDLVQLFKWAQKRQPYRRLLVEGNPMDLIDIEKILPDDFDPGSVRDRILYPNDIRELRDIFERMEATYSATPAGKKYDVPRPLKKENQLALWICLGTMCRIGELLMSKWEDVDLKTGIWFVPKENVKGRKGGKKSQTVALSTFTLAQFKALHGLTGDTLFCFPNSEKNNHVDVKTITKIVGDCQSKFKVQTKPLKGRRNDDSLVLNDGKDGNWTPHDLRRTGSTMLQALGEDTNMIDRCQNHKIDEPKTRAHYMHYKYRLPKRKIWERLGLEIENILAGKPDWQDQYL